MELDFSGQIVLITGASRGIGLQIAKEFLSCGAQLIVTSTSGIDEETLHREFNRDTTQLVVDFSNRESFRKFLADIRSLEKLDVCVNNAGTSRHTPFLEASDDDWEMTNQVNLKGPYFVSQAAAEVMQRSSYGRIVNISSIWGHITMPSRSVYGATKCGLHGLTTGAAVELAQSNILVNTISPGFTLTDMVRKNYTDSQREELSSKIPIGRLADPSEIANAVLFFASSLNSYITGQSLLVDGGYSVL